MRRRELLKAAAMGVTALAAPLIGRAEKTKKLVFVPTEDLNVLDPHFTGSPLETQSRLSRLRYALRH
jgi:hypothetical protein